MRLSPSVFKLGHAQQGAIEVADTNDFGVWLHAQQVRRMSPSSDRQLVLRTRCKARKRNGDPCRNPPTRGHDLCKQHSGDPDVGRRLRLTPPVRAMIVEALHAGLYMADAITYAGVSERSVYAWLEQGRADYEAGRETVFSQFSQAVAEVSVRVKLRAVALWQASFVDHPSEISKFLAARYPHEWGRRNHNVDDHGRNVGVELEILGGRQPIDVDADIRKQIAELLVENDARRKRLSLEQGGQPHVTDRGGTEVSHATRGLIRRTGGGRLELP
jgi:hypothetical protein